MTKKSITQADRICAIGILVLGRAAVKAAGEYCQELIDLLGDVEPGATTDAVYGGGDIDELLEKLGITVEE